MYRILTLIFTCFTFSATGQHMTSIEWDKEARNDKRLLPKYGYQIKTAEELKADQEFIKSSLIKESRRDASDDLIGRGFQSLYGDLRTAMYRFNQAYLLDSTNSDIYWGYGAVYMTLGDYQKAKAQYVQGLAINDSNTHLLTEYGSYFLAQYYGLESFSKKEAMDNLDSAIGYLVKSYKIDPKDQNTSFRLSVCYSNKGNCSNAWKYYNLCKSLGGTPITEEYTAELESKCAQKN